jgi:curved DNA-binding protein CbpA
VNKDKEAAKKFQEVSEAYEVFFATNILMEKIFFFTGAER